MPRIELSDVAPSLFVCYRRADEPFAAALTASILDDLVGSADVFSTPFTCVNEDRSRTRSSMPSGSAGWFSR